MFYGNQQVRTPSNRPEACTDDIKINSETIVCGAGCPQSAIWSYSATEKSPMTMKLNEKPCHTAGRMDQQGARPLVVHRARIEKYRTGRSPVVRQARVVRIITGSTKSNNPASTSKINLLKCQRPMFISTFNARTWNGQARQGEITAMSEKYQIDVTCNQEHRIYHTGDTVKLQDLGNGWMIITSSAQKAETNATIRGVCILVSPRAYREVSSTLNR